MTAPEKRGAEAPGKTARALEHILGLVDDGMSPGDRLPTERDLAAQLGMSRLTVRRAIGLLEGEGRIYRVQGAGTFVANPRILKNIELTSFTEDMLLRGKIPGSLSVSAERVAAGAALGYRLHVPPASPVVHIQRVRTADGEPMCIEDAYLRGDSFPEDLRLAPGDSLYERMSCLGSVGEPHHANQSIQATVLQEEDSGRLQVPPFSPALLVERTVFNVHDTAVEFARSLYRADRFSFELTVERTQQRSVVSSQLLRNLRGDRNQAKGITT